MNYFNDLCLLFMFHCLIVGTFAEDFRIEDERNGKKMKIAISSKITISDLSPRKDIKRKLRKTFPECIGNGIRSDLT